MKSKKGYSMIVLVIAITVILILATSAISMLQISREKTRITNFIFDINTVEDEVQDFYIRTGTLPTENLEKVDMNYSPEILSQLSPYDNENYYKIDLSQLGMISLRDSTREYIVNEGSLKVYVKKGVEYTKFDDEKQKMIYYTLTSNLVNGLEQYTSQDEDILIVGNPIAWCKDAKLRVVLPRRNLEQTGGESWENWTFKWDFGPKTQSELEEISASDEARNFKYGDALLVKSNGIYSIYVKSPDGKVTVTNVNVNKIDDISPAYRFSNDLGVTRIETVDNETGISEIRYKTLKDYKRNVQQAQIDNPDGLEARTEIDYFLIDGEGKDLMYTFSAEIENFKKVRDNLIELRRAEVERFDRWENNNEDSLLTEDERIAAEREHLDYIDNIDVQLDELYNSYPYLAYPDGETEESRIVLYIKDYSGNATVVGHNDFISTKIIGDSYNISTEGLGKVEI